MSAENTGDVFSALLSNPAMLSSIASLLSNMPKDTPPADSGEGAEHGTENDTENGAEHTNAQTDGSGAGAQAIPDLSGILSTAMQNPQLLAALPKMMSTLSGVFGSKEETQKEEQKEGHRDESGAAFPLLSKGSSHPRPAKVTDRRSALLLALKPYMSHDKAEMIDTIVRIIEIMSLIK
ncbi:MAG: hypothetical protein UHG68_02930 [Clostridia bacterium]|nr:hypothetical protein [Clostridia bacterium]